MKKIAQYPIFVFIFLIIYGIVYFLGVENPLLRTIIATTLALFLSPRRKKIETLQGKTKQITWIFLKKPIHIE